MIFWFSGTGNSYWSAKELGKTLNEPLVDMAAAIRSGRLNYYVHESEKVGFVFPVYFMGLPSVVDKFIEIMQLSGKQNPEIFAVLTCGQSCGMADELLEKALGKRSLKLYSTYRLVMPDDYVLMYNVGSESEMKKLASSKAKLAIVAAKIKQEWKCQIKHSATDAAMTKVFQPMYHGGRKTKKFYADDACVGCGLCAAICPVEAIRITDSGKPEWTKPRCVMCLGCINRCPEHSIQYGSATKKRGRYVHPIYEEK